MITQLPHALSFGFGGLGSGEDALGSGRDAFGLGVFIPIFKTFYFLIDIAHVAVVQ